ncbi:discoidin-1 subunit A-like [Porites lutea]|uniref:discoidin-1 subunit A-like n=1 Tax=Porites lutea TaxID=51062 RepID=UPI003CC623FC
MYEVLDPTRCRYLRVQALGWSEKVSLRVELYGYKEECSDHLRSTFSASSSAGFSLPGYGYLHSGIGSGAWCAQEHNVNQYLQAKLSSESIVTGVATQGQKSSDSWVNYFSLDYSLDDRAWIQYAGGKTSRIAYDHVSIIHSCRFD